MISHGAAGASSVTMYLMRQGAGIGGELPDRLLGLLCACRITLMFHASAKAAVATSWLRTSELPDCSANPLPAPMPERPYEPRVPGFVSVQTLRFQFSRRICRAAQAAYQVRMGGHWKRGIWGVDAGMDGWHSQWPGRR